MLNAKLGAVCGGEGLLDVFHDVIDLICGECSGGVAKDESECKAAAVGWDLFTAVFIDAGDGLKGK